MVFFLIWEGEKVLGSAFHGVKHNTHKVYIRYSEVKRAQQRREVGEERDRAID